jgi:pyruvate ferredoxin oxidoreductase gamma subunit
MQEGGAMKEVFEIRWHGRGGQGAKTAALLFGDAALSTGKFIQAFPEYGPERMGAPVQSFNRLSDKPIRIHSGITNPDIVIVLDPTLMQSIDVTQGLADNGRILINTNKSPKEVREAFGIKGKKIATCDAYKISEDTIGKKIPNTPMLGALIKVTGILDFAQMLKDTEEKLGKKFKGRPEIVQGNINSIKRAYEEVQQE